MDSSKLELKSNLELKDLLKAIDYLGNIISSGETIHTYKQSPIHILVHNEILRHSKEDIDSFKEDLRFGRNLYNISFGIRNPYIFSAFLKVGAFQDKLSTEAKWLLKSRKKTSDDLYSLVFMVEESNSSKRINNHSIYSEGLTSKEDLFNCLLNHYLYKLDTPEKIEILDKYFKDFGKKMSSNFVEYVFKNHHHKSELCDYLVVKLKNMNIDLSKNNLLNILLPKEESWNSKKSKFFISSTEIPRIKKLLECGFKFDEKNYSYQGDNLFISVIKSERVDIIKTIIPYLSDVTPKSGTLEEQSAFIDDLAKKINNPTDQVHYNLIKTHYQKCLLEAQLNSKYVDKKIKFKI